MCVTLCVLHSFFAQTKMALCFECPAMLLIKTVFQLTKTHSHTHTDTQTHTVGEQMTLWYGKAFMSLSVTTENTTYANKVNTVWGQIHADMHSFHLGRCQKDCSPKFWKIHLKIMALIWLTLVVKQGITPDYFVFFYSVVRTSVMISLKTKVELVEKGQQIKQQM